MAQPYTDEEITGAVEQILRSRIRHSIGVLGQRDVGVTFNDFQEQTTAVMTLTPNAPFYVVRLGCGRLGDKVETLADLVVNLDQAVQALGRYPTSVTSITDLSNAKVAAEALSLAGAGRTGAFKAMDQLPAFQRLDRNIESFLTNYSAPNLRRSNTLVLSQKEGRDAIPGLVRDLKEQRASVLGSVNSLASALADYEALDLPQLLSSGVVERAAQVIKSRTDELEALEPQDRVGRLRAITLDLLAARTIIRNFGSLKTPTAFIPSEGTGAPYASTSYPAISASLVMPLPGPYRTQVNSVLISSQLDFLIDGAFRTVVSVSGSFVANMTGRISEPYPIYSSGPQQNDQINVKFSDLGVDTDVVVALTSGATVTAQQIANEINAAIALAGAKPFEAVVAPAPKKFEGKVNIAGAGPYTFVSTNSFNSWTTLGIAINDKIQVTEGANILSTFLVTVVTASTLTATQLSGPAVTPETNKLIVIGLLFALKLKVLDSYAATALLNSTSISIGTFDNLIRTRACATLGFTSGSISTSNPTPLGIVNDLINASTLTAQLGVSRLKSSITTTPWLAAQPIHTDPARTTTAFIYRFRGIGNITVGGLAATLVVPGLTGTVVVGDEIIIRTTTIPADMNQRGVITGVASTTITATFTVALTITSNVTVDIAPDLSALPANTVIVVADGSNAGTYRVTGQGSVIKSELSMNKGWQAPQDFSGQPNFLTGDISLEYLTVASTKTDLTTAIQLDDGVPPNPYTAAYLFAPTRPFSTVGTTSWFSLEDLPKELQVGDVIELHLSAYETSDYTVAVTSISRTDGVVGIEPAIPVTVSSVSFRAGVGVPFGRIRRVRRDNFDLFKTEATTWLVRPQFQDQWLTQLERFITVVLSSPTPSNLHDTRVFLQDLLGLLTIDGAAAMAYPTSESIQSIAEAYRADVVGEIDTLVQSLYQQGADRAADVLLEAKFQQYFGFSADQMSYAGNVLALTKQMMQQDLQVSAVRRGGGQRQISLGSFDEPDYEYDQQDIDTGLVPDAPGGNPPPRQGDAY